jgi:hypothetical protein
MRQYAWYSPELDVIVLQYIIEDCYIAFEWDIQDLWLHRHCMDTGIDPMHNHLWTPLGEL